jgi:DNA-binding NarL/FixJ family response regulator
MHDRPAYLEAAISTGATGYVLKSAVGEELLEAVGKVLEGGVYVTPSLSEERLKTHRESAPATALLRLSSRERETLQLIAEGKTSKEIAFILKISIKTVAFHRANIQRKLGLKMTAELTRYAAESRLV